MKLQLNFQIVRFLNYKQTFSDTLPPKQGDRGGLHIQLTYKLRSPPDLPPKQGE